VAASITDLTAPTPPAVQSLASGTTTASATWTHPGAPAGTTYTCAVRGSDGSTPTASGSGLGAWTWAVADGTAYAATLTASSGGQESRSDALVSVASAALDADYAVVEGSTVDFTDADWTALSSTGTTQSTSAWQHTLYEADGTTPRAYVGNNSATARTLSLTPSDVGLKLTCGVDTGNAVVAVWPAGWGDIMGGSRDDAWVAEFVVGGEEPSGSGAFVHILGVSTGFSNVSPLIGLRVLNSGSNVAISGTAYPVAFDEVSLTTVAGAGRSWTARVQVRLIDGGSAIRVWVEPSTTAMASPRTGTYEFKVQRSSEAIGTGEFTVPGDIFASTIAGRFKLVLYHDRVAGGTTSTSYVRLLSARLWKKTGGSL
jgi:hypothetical protein